MQSPGNSATGQSSHHQQSVNLTALPAAHLGQNASLTPGQGWQTQVSHRLQKTAPTACSIQPPPGPRIRKYLELCVNTGKFHKSLGEIDITLVNCDRDLFALTKQRYNEVRGHRIKFSLLEPVAIEWVQFSLEEQHRVGILLHPLAVPPKNEVDSNHYEYNPCPLEPLPPIPDNIFLHHLNDPGPHRRPIWLQRLPKKVNDSLLRSGNGLVTGWGVHIIEGPNWLAVWIVGFCIVFSSGLFAVAWSVWRGDVSAGFGVAGWMASVLTMTIMVCFSKWSRE